MDLVTECKDKKKKELLNPTQLLGLKYYEDIKKKIPREEIQKYERIFNKNKIFRNIISNMFKYLIFILFVIS